MTFDLKSKKKIFVTGHRGLVGSALVRALERRGLKENLILKTRQELDLLDQRAVRDFMSATRPDVLLIAAARVGGIHANSTYPVEFMYENVQLEMNLIKTAADFGVEKLLFLGSSCIYPKMSPQPIHEDALLTSALEESNESYALAKICGLKLCQYYKKQYSKNFISGMPTNLYGPGDNFHPVNSHVIPGLMRRFHYAKVENAPTVSVWGTGKAMREFLHVDDLAEGCMTLLEKWEGDQWVNIGSGVDVTISDLVALMAKVVGYEGKLVYDPSKPDGTPRKVTDVTKIQSLGWHSRISLEEGLRSTYEWVLKNKVFE